MWSIERRNCDFRIPRLQEPLAGFIFVCSEETMHENLQRRLFGLPRHYSDLVKCIRKGLPLFLYNCTTRRLHGIYEASSDGGVNLEPDAWRSRDFRIVSRFPAQVRVRLRERRPPLEENEFRPLLFRQHENKFRLELSLMEVVELIKLFRSIPEKTVKTPEIARGRTPEITRGRTMDPSRRGLRTGPLRVEEQRSLQRLRENAAELRNKAIRLEQYDHRSMKTNQVINLQQLMPDRRASPDMSPKKSLPMAYSFISLKTGVCTMMNCKTQLLPDNCVQVWNSWKSRRDFPGPADHALKGARSKDEDSSTMQREDYTSISVKEDENNRARTCEPCPEGEKGETGKQTEDENEFNLTGRPYKWDAGSTSDNDSTTGSLMGMLPGILQSRGSIDRDSLFKELIQDICGAESSPASSQAPRLLSLSRSQHRLSPYRVLFRDKNKELLNEVLASLSEEAKLIEDAWRANLEELSVAKQPESLSSNPEASKISSKETDPLYGLLKLKEESAGSTSCEASPVPECFSRLKNPEVTTGFYVKMSREELLKKLPAKSKSPSRSRVQNQVKEHFSTFGDVGLITRKRSGMF